MTQSRTSPIKTLALIPALLGWSQGAAVIAEETAAQTTTSPPLIAQSIEPATIFSNESIETLPAIRSGNEHTIITHQGNTTLIEGGVRAEGNLFHRFDGFGIGVGETADFITPRSTQAVFGQVSGGGASFINGRIQISGSEADLYLINPAGILFGPNAQLNISGSFSATTADRVDFANGWLTSTEDNYESLTGAPEAYRFTTDSPGAVVNQADLAASKGQAIRLIGGDVVNTGSLEAAGGEITLSAVGPSDLADSTNGAQKLVRLSAEGSLLSVEVAEEAIAPATWNPLSLPELLSGAGTNADWLRVNADGSIDLVAADAVTALGDTEYASGRVLFAGAADVSDDIGGKINLLGTDIRVAEGRLNASGDLGGGSILIGGDYQGKGELPAAERLVFEERAIATADSLVDGDGGQIVLWSDGTTHFDGALSAIASGTGTGGLVETSGLKTLSIGQQASVSTQAESGQTGTWLLDPQELRVAPTTNGAEIINGTNAPSNLSILDPVVLANALNGNNVELQASEAIYIDAAVDATGNTAAGTLRFDAPTLTLNEKILLSPDSDLLPGTANRVNVGVNGSVQNAVDAVATGGTVELAAATYTEGRTIEIARDVTLQGQDASSTILSGDTARRVLTLSGASQKDGIEVNIDSLAIREGASDLGAGIAVLDGTNLLLTNSHVEDNENINGANAIGGGLFFGSAGTSVIRNTRIHRNVSSGNGGGLIVDGTHQLTIENSDISNNNAWHSGGAIDSNSIDAAISIIGGDFKENRAGSGGGAISIDDTSLSIDGTSFRNNTAEDWGGAINFYTRGSVIKNAEFLDNISIGGSGGAIATSGVLNISDTLFSRNQARVGEGGAIVTQGGGDTQISRSEFYQNDARTYGGGISTATTHQMTVTDSTFHKNFAQEEGGAIRIYSNSVGLLKLTNSTLFDNYSEGDGGGLYIATNDAVTIDGSTIIKNGATGEGGGIYVVSGGTGPAISRTLVSNNFASLSGSDIQGAFASGGHNLVKNRAGSIANYQSSDLPDGTDPMLGASFLADNGGGIPTVALPANSPAIDSGGLAAPGDVDQRGFAVVGVRDIGAYEFGAATPQAVSNLTFVEGENQSATVDTSYATLFQVKVTDILGAALSGIQVNFTLPDSGPSGIVNASASSLTTDANGIASLMAKAGQVAGSYLLRAETTDGLASATTTVTNQADVASKFDVSGPTSELTAGEVVNFSIIARDRFNNVADSYSNTVTLSTTDTNAVLPETGVLTNGIGNFEATPITAGTQSLTVADSTNPNLAANVNNIAVTSAVGAVLSTPTGGNATATVGTAFDNGLTVEISDRFGNPVAGEAVTFSVPNAGASALLDSEVVLTNASGLATTTLRANETAGSYQAIASAIGKSSIFELTNEADEAAIPSPTIDPPPVDPPDPTPVDPPNPAPVDPSPTDPIPVAPTPTDSTTAAPPIANYASVISDGRVPLEGTTEAESASKLLSKTELQKQPSPSKIGGVFDEVAFAETERLLSEEYAKYWQLPVSKTSTIDSIQDTLQQAQAHHKAKSAVVYALFVPTGESDYSSQYPSVLSQRLLRNELQADEDRLMLVMVPPKGQPVQRLMDVSRGEIVRQAQLLGIEISLVEERGYQPLARQLYNWLLAPLETELESSGIENLMYVMDEGLRTVPLAAMMAGDRFAIEKYGISALPSMGLLNADFDTAPAEQNVLTAGADRFEHLEALPAVPIELGLVGKASTSAQLLLNKAFSLDGLLAEQAARPKTMMHLATHAAFNPGALDRSYVQLWDEQLTLDEISNLDLTGLEMLILSACSTAMGSQDAELGFAGLAAATGVEASVGSLWNVSDTGTMALMAEFYEQLSQNPLRFAALQQAQLSLLKGETRLENNQLVTQKGENPLPANFANEGTTTFSHPFFWSGFTLIGSPWW